MSERLPPGWRRVRLGEVCEVVGGGTPAKGVAEYHGGAIPWATIRDMHSAALAATEHTITEQGLKASSSKLIPAGEVIMASRVGLGKVCVLMQDTAINQDIRAVIPKRGVDLDRAFLFRWLQSKASDIVAAGSGATVQGIKLPFIRGLEIPVPPLDDQRRIVAKLDQAFAALDRAAANVEAAVRNASALFSAILEDTFCRHEQSWASFPLIDLGATQTGSTPDTSDPDCFGDHLPFVKPGDFRTDGTIALRTEGLSKSGAARSRLVPAGSALMVCIGATIGKAGFTDENVATNQQINAVIPKAEVSGQFIYFQFTRGSFQRSVIQQAGRRPCPSSASRSGQPFA